MSSLSGKSFIIRGTKRDEYLKVFRSSDELLCLAEPETIFSVKLVVCPWDGTPTYQTCGAPLTMTLTKEFIEKFFQEVPEKLVKYLFKSFMVVNRKDLHNFKVGSVIKITGINFNHSWITYDWTDSEGNHKDGGVFLAEDVEFLDECCIPVEKIEASTSLEDYIFECSHITDKELASHLIKYGDITAKDFAKVKPELFVKHYEVSDFYSWIMDVPYGYVIKVLTEAKRFSVSFDQCKGGGYATDVEVLGSKIYVKKESLDKYCREVV